MIADDEQLAREELCFLLERLSDVQIVAQVDNGLSALEEIERLTPDVAFLDVHMPGLTGFEVARRLLERGVDLAVVFVTAFDQRAVEAFEVNAVDYLLKPVDAARLEQAVQRVRRRRGQGAEGHARLLENGATASAENGAALPTGGLFGTQLDQLMRLMAAQRDRRGQIAMKVGERIVIVQTEEIVYASLAGDSITIGTGQIAGTSNFRTLDELQARLDPDYFWRVHRSHLVNINKIKEIVPWFSRNYILRMRDAKGTEIPVSRSQTRRLREYLKL